MARSNSSDRSIMANNLSNWESTPALPSNYQAMNLPDDWDVAADAPDFKSDLSPVSSVPKRSWKQEKQATLGPSFEDCIAKMDPHLDEDYRIPSGDSVAHWLLSPTDLGPTNPDVFPVTKSINHLPSLSPDDTSYATGAAAQPPLSPIASKPTASLGSYQTPVGSTNRKLDMNQVEVPTDMDILFGRGGGTNTSPGNIAFRQKAFSLWEWYTLAGCFAPTKSKKIREEIAKMLVESMKMDGHRFLDVDENGEWHNVIKGSQTKASQLLRDLHKWNRFGSPAQGEQLAPLPLL